MDKQRGSAASRGYDARWRAHRESYLKSHPLCVQCHAEGRVEAATVIDHIEPHRGNVGKFCDVQNMQALCERHHNAKTAGGA